MDRLEANQHSIFNDQKYSLPGERIDRKITNQQNTPKLDDLQIPDTKMFTTPSRWQVLCNLKLLNDQNDQVLEVDDQSFHAFAQSNCALEPTNPHFKIKLLNFDYFKYMAIGLSSKGHLTDVVPGLYEQSVGFDSTGDLIVNKISKKVGKEWKVGDVLECGIRYPNNFLDSQRASVKLYLKINEQLVTETKVLMPTNGYFTTIYMYEGVLGCWWENGSIGNISGTSTKVRFYE